MKAAKNFIGIVKGKEKRFRKGKDISPAEAKELNLAAKPHLVERARNETKPTKT